MNKKITCLLLIVVLIFSSITPIAADNPLQQAVDTLTELINPIIKLSDLVINGVSHWGKEYIEKLVEKQIIIGYPDGTFKPNNSVEVDSFIKMVVCSLGYSFENGKDYWAMPYINKAKELKLIDGTEFDTYRRIITREEAAKVIVNALATKEQLPSEEQINKYITKVPDYSKIGANYKKVVLYAYATGMITGNENGYFNPKSNLSRAEAATVIMRLLDASLRKPVDIEDELKNPIPELLKTDEEVWMMNDINAVNEVTNIGKDYDVHDGKLYFKYKGNSTYNLPSYSNYLPKETLNTEINKQIHDLTKVLISENYYVPTYYNPHIGDQPGYIGVTLSKSEGYIKNGIYFFGYSLFEDNYAPIGGINNQFSKKATIGLVLNQLWWQRNEDGSLYNIEKDGWSSPFYAKKLEKSCIVLFGMETGKKVFDYVHNVYINERTKQDSQKQRFKTTTIDNIQIDFYNDYNKLYFYFTIKNK